MHDGEKKNGAAPILEVRGLNKSYESEPVIADISLSLFREEMVCLLGLSGIGKTTLFHIIAGLYPPDSGSVWFEGGEITASSGHVGYMQQKDLLLPYKTVLDNVALPLLIRGVDKKEARRRAKEHFEEFGIAGDEQKYPAQLSGGMRQRAALLRTYLFSSEVFLLDEPFSALDALTKRAMHEWYLALVGRLGLSTLIITHDIDEAIILADRIYVMGGNPGRITAELKVAAPRPRHEHFSMTPEFLDIKRELVALLGV